MDYEKMWNELKSKVGSLPLEELIKVIRIMSEIQREHTTLYIKKTLND